MAIMKVAVYSIALNEEKFVERWYESAKEADYLLIADTGSTDKTIEIAERLGINVFKIHVYPWRFDDSRNAALALVPESIDYCISLDIDEILQPGWRAELEKAYEKGGTLVRSTLSTTFDENNNPLTKFGCRRIHARKNFRWVYPVHEVISSVGEPEVSVWTDIQIYHWPDNTKSRGQYLPLLETAAKESPMDPRCAFYYGRELFFYKRYEEASKEFTRFLRMPNSLWKPERSSACRYLAKCEPEKAEEHLLQAINEDESRRESYVDLAHHYYNSAEWQKCYDMAIKALEFTEQPLDYFCEGHAWGWLPHDLASISAWNLGNVKEAIKHEIDALEHLPNDGRMKNNLAIYLRTAYFEEKATVVIPTKSNFLGLVPLVESLEKDPQVHTIVIVGDGLGAYNECQRLFTGRSKIVVEQVPGGIGIHNMWNIGIEYGRKNNTAMAFINDDVEIEGYPVGTLVSLVAHDKNLGLVCPDYDNRSFPTWLVDVAETCGGRYDGTGGFAGFFIVLPKDLTQRWYFDERMKWWYGDDDVIKWCLVQDKRVVISNIAKCSGNQSITSRVDPPKDFSLIVQQDKIIYQEKWGEAGWEPTDPNSYATRDGQFSITKVD